MPTLARRHATRGPSTLNPQPSTRNGFTLIELIIVILVMLILMTLTVALVGNMLDSDRVRGASRQIQNYLAGARDRAIYSASRTEDGGIPPRVGVRFLSDPSLINPTTGKARAFSSMVYVQEVAPMPTTLRIWEDKDTASPTFGQWLASQCRNFDDDPKARLPGDDGLDGDGQLEPLDPLSIRSVNALISRGLIESRLEPVGGSPVRFYYLQVNFDDDRSRQTFYVRFRNDSTVNNVDPTTGRLLEGVLSRAYFNPAIENAVAPCHFRLLPSPMPNEEPRLLPTGVVIDARSSLIGGAPRGVGGFVDSDMTLENLSRADGSFDIMFNAQGIVDGPIAAAGLMHLVVADLEDLARGYRLINFLDPDPTAPGPVRAITGNAFVDTNTAVTGFDDTDGDGNPDERQNDVMIVSIRTQTGSVYSSDVNPVTHATTDPTNANYGRLLDPFKIAETGGEAK